ncbi:MAG: hypothetical protein KGO49_06480 [Gammaproteobacteria bacterium]|nr:hypothetical protein [Gammaproteobacteria bacterium]
MDKNANIFRFYRMQWLWVAILLILLSVILVPLNPDMPISGLDPSWKFAINQAVVQKLKIGQDAIFTFGPYASIYTRMYHPNLDNLMIFGGLFLTIGYTIIFSGLLRKSNLLWIFLVIFFMTAFYTICR